MTVDTFKPEIEQAARAFDKYVVCLEKAPDDCEASLLSLMGKAITAYNNRGPNLRHGIALDRHLTIILSQSETERPLCAIYFNLSTPYYKKGALKGGGREAKAEK